MLSPEVKVPKTKHDPASLRPNFRQTVDLKGTIDSEQTKYSNIDLQNELGTLSSEQKQTAYMKQRNLEILNSFSKTTD